MSKLTAARLYMCLALLLAVVSWRICQGFTVRMEAFAAEQEREFDRTLSFNDGN